MSAFANTRDIFYINPYDTVSVYTYDDDYKMTHGLSSIDLITLITNINKLRDAEIESSINMINKSISNNEDSIDVITIEFIRYVTWLLSKYSSILQYLKDNPTNCIVDSADDGCTTIKDSIPIIKYQNIRDKKLQKSVKDIATILFHLSKITLKRRVFMGGQPIIVDDNRSNLLFANFGINETTDLSKFVTQGAGGTRKKRRRKTSKATKKHRKSSRRHRRRRN
jgi:hypothetical protein